MDRLWSPSAGGWVVVASGRREVGWCVDPTLFVAEVAVVDGGSAAGDLGAAGLFVFGLTLAFERGAVSFDVLDDPEFGGGQVWSGPGETGSDPGSAVVDVVGQVGVFGVAVKLVGEVFPGPVVPVE